MYSSRLHTRRAAVAIRVPGQENARQGVHSKCVEQQVCNEELQEESGHVLHEEDPGANEPVEEDDVATQLGSALKDFDQVVNFSAFGRFFQQAKTQVLDVAQSPAVKFVGSVVTQISDVTENIDQRMDQFLTGIVNAEGDENSLATSPLHLPVSNPSAPMLERPTDPPRGVQQPPIAEDWGDFDWDDDASDIDQPVTQQPDYVPPQQRERVVCRSIDVSGVKESAQQRSPLHPHTPHTPALGSPETMTHVHMNQDKQPLHESSHELLRQDSKENDMSRKELVERCAVLAEQSRVFQQQCQTLMAENTRLKNDTAHEGDTVMAEQLANQVQHLMQEKARILQEKDWLEKENGNLQQLLDFACASMGRASSPDEGEADPSPLPACEEACPA